MRQTLRITAAWAFCVLVAVSTFAQTRPMVGTVIDVDEGRNRLQIETDEEQAKRVMIEIDSVSTTWYGFGTMIAGRPEIFTGTSGLANVRLGDRVEVRGSVTTGASYQADQVTLLGRTVEAPQVGVGQTRPPASATTPTDDTTSATLRNTNAGTVEGTIRQINDEEGRLVIQTPQRRMITVRVYRNTPVHYRGQTYRVTNLEVGDRIRVEADPREAQADEIIARRIDVTMSAQEAGTIPGTGGSVTIVEGRVARVEPGLDYAYITTERGEVRVDMRQAEDSRGGVVHARDLQVGDDVEISGSYNRVGDMFLASTVRYGGLDEDDLDREDRLTAFGLVTMNGTVTETLEDGPTIALRDRDSGRTVRLWVADDFVVQTRANTYSTAENLRVNDTVVVDAFRDEDGNLIAQTIRIRNR